MIRTQASFLASIALFSLACGGTVEPDQGEGGGGEDATSSTSTTSASTSQGAGGGGEGGAGGEGGGVVQPSEVCQRLQSVFITDLRFVDASGDGVWSPGESAAVEVTLWNYSAEGNFDYPGVEIWSDHAYVQPTGGNTNFLFGLEPDGQAALTVDFTAAERVTLGDTANLSVRVINLIEPCDFGATSALPVTIEAPVPAD